MSDYTDIIYLSAAMIIFSMLTTNTAKSFMNTSDTVVRSDIEYRAIAIAQNEIDQVKLLSRDSEQVLKAGSNSYKYTNYPRTIIESYGSSDQYSDQFTMEATSELIKENDLLVNRYLITVKVINKSISPNVEVELKYIKAFEK